MKYCTSFKYSLGQYPIFPGGDVQFSSNLNEDDGNTTMEYNNVSVGIYSHESQRVPTTTDSIQIILPFELEKVLSPKTTVTPSGKKSA